MLIERFLNSAHKNPQSRALHVAGADYTYQYLAQEVLQLVHLICAAIPHPVRLGIFCYKSPLSYIATLASAYLGLTFVPLNKNLAAARLADMVNAVRPDIIIVDSISLKSFHAAALFFSYQPIILTEEDIATSQKPPSHRIKPTKKIDKASTIAYVLFTSGSTGQPKGAMVSYKSLESFIAFNQKRYKINATDILSQTFEHTFDLAIFDIFMALCHGACLCVPGPMQLLTPVSFINENLLSVWFSVPSVINLARLRQGLPANSLPTLRLSLFCGEPLTIEAAATWQKAAPHSILENLYGPTELTIACAAYRYQADCPIAVNGIVPIGTIYKGLQYKILDSNNVEVKQGAVGELCVAGAQVFNGYLNDVEQTQKSQVCLVTGTYYRTGDKVKLIKHGVLAYLGRSDQQIKINGYRVDLTEVESVMRKDPAVIDAAVVGWPEMEGSHRGLVGFVTGPMICAEKIILDLKNYLPAYMVPKKIICLAQIPLNSNKKVNKQALKNYLIALEK